GADISVQVRSVIGDGRKLHHRVVQLRPAKDDGVLAWRSLKRSPHVIDDDLGSRKFANERLKTGCVARLKMKLDRQAVVGGQRPQALQLWLAKWRQPIGGIRVDANADDRQFAAEFGQLVERAFAIRKEEQSAFEHSF